MPGPRLELTEPLDLNTIIPYSLLDLQAPVPGKPIIANTGLNIAWILPEPAGAWFKLGLMDPKSA